MKFWLESIPPIHQQRNITLVVNRWNSFYTLRNFGVKRHLNGFQTAVTEGAFYLVVFLQYPIIYYSNRDLRPEVDPIERTFT